MAIDRELHARRPFSAAEQRRDECDIVENDIRSRLELPHGRGGHFHVAHRWKDDCALHHVIGQVADRFVGNRHLPRRSGGVQTAAEKSDGDPPGSPTRGESNVSGAESNQ